jgi:hypothetical protein
MKVGRKNMDLETQRMQWKLVTELPLIECGSDCESLIPLPHGIDDQCIYLREANKISGDRSVLPVLSFKLHLRTKPY